MEGAPGCLLEGLRIAAEAQATGLCFGGLSVDLRLLLMLLSLQHVAHRDLQAGSRMELGGPAQSAVLTEMVSGSMPWAKMLSRVHLEDRRY